MRIWAKGAWLAAFEKHLTDLALSPTTIVNYLADVRAFASWFMTRKQAVHSTSTPDGGQGASPSVRKQALAWPQSEASPDDIRAYRHYLEAVEERAPATVNRRLQALRKFCQFAVQSGWMSANPTLEVTLLPEPEVLPPRTLTADEKHALLQAVQSARQRFAKRDRAILELLLAAGLRVSEITGLKVEHITLEDQGGFITVEGGNSSGSRQIPLNAEVCQTLREYLTDRPADSQSPFLFLSQQGRPISTRSIQRLVAVYARAAGLEDVTAYTLRHTCAAGWIQAMGDRKTVARLLGHQRPETIAKYMSEKS